MAKTELTLKTRGPLTDLDKTVAGMPKLLSLDVTAPSVSSGPLSHPRLEKVYANIDDAESFTRLLAASGLPRLKFLRLGSGSMDRPMIPTSALSSLLAEPASTLEALLLLGVASPGEVCIALVGAPLLKTIRRLQITGQFTPQDLNTVSDHRRFFEHLEDFVIAPLLQDIRADMRLAPLCIPPRKPHDYE
jgi:hypothetical protein